MTPARWSQIKELFSAALETPESERPRFLESACGGDAELRAEVERMLAGNEEPSWQSPAAKLFTAAAEFAPGDTVAHYRIEARLGEGGMGVVYKAKDTRLGRSVALKFVKAQFDRRSEREARAVAALNHPNICTLHDVGPNYLVMELIEGPTLAERLTEGPIPLQETLDIARQIAEALEAAHEKGIVHRDLKPANIKLTAEGTVKVLDFGLAKAQESAARSAEDSPTLTATQAGTILGTAGYMSPEQTAGKPVDKRADIWSFGVVLWELLTGHRLFEGETVTQTLAEVLRGPIDFDQLPRETPAAIRGLLRRCLDRSAKNRLRDIGEARIAIESALAGETPLEGAPEPGGARRLWLASSVATVLAAGVALFAFLYFRERPLAPAAPMRFQIPPPENTTLEPYPVLSPDGRKLAFSTGEGDRLWVHFLESGESRDLAASDAGVPFWSPDSRFIGYPSGGKLKKIEATGGTPQSVADCGSWGGGAWNQDDVIVFADQRVGLFRVPASGGIPVRITAVDYARQETFHSGPSFLPDGRHFVYTRLSTDEKKSAVYVGSVDSKPEQQSSKPLVTSNWRPMYVPSADPSTGYLLFMRDSTLTAQPFDNRRLELKGQASPIAEQVDDGAFSASANDVLVFQRNAASDLQLTWYDREGKVLGTAGEPGDYQGLAPSPGLALSPDGTRLAVSKSSGKAANIWLLDLSQGGASTRFTFGSASDTNPVWSPDGSRIIFSSNRDGQFNLYQKPANGVKGEELLLKSSEDKRATSWSPDGRFLLYQATHPKTRNDIWVLPLEGDRKPVPFLITEFTEGQARFSPDGHWVAYNSNESGHFEVYVRSFSMNSAGTAVEAGGKWQISNGFGRAPRWRGDGRELYYRSGDGGVMAVQIATNPAFRAGNPRPVGPRPDPHGPGRVTLWDSIADGKRLLVPVVKRGPEPYTVVLNWQAGLKK